MAVDRMEMSQKWHCLAKVVDFEEQELLIPLEICRQTTIEAAVLAMFLVAWFFELEAARLQPRSV